MTRTHRAAVDVGAKRLDVHARREVDELGALADRAVQPAPEVVAEIGEHVAAVADAAQRLPGAGQHRPARLVSVRRRHDAPGAGPAQRGREQPERRGGAEPHGGAVELAQRLDRPPARPGVGTSSPPGCRSTGNGCAASNAAEPAGSEA